MSPSKRIVDRTKDARAVAASITTHAEAVARDLGSLLESHLEPDEKLPDLALLMRLLGRVIERDANDMSEADTAHQTELADDPNFRKTRDEKTAELVTAIVQMREALDGVYGAAAIQRYGIEGKTPREPAEIVAFAEALADRLSSDPLPTPRFPASLDRLAMAAELRVKLAPLKEALKDVAREVREAEATLVARDAATTRFDRNFGRSATALTALFRLAGQEELASRIRPSGRKPGRLASPDEPQDEASGDGARSEGAPSEAAC